MATIAFYGPNANFASKVVATVHRDSKHREMRKWHADAAAETVDVRNDPQITAQLGAFLQSFGELREIVMTEGIIGCPHEEGVDYPEGAHCPLCPYWAGRDRFTHEMIN